MLRKCLLTSVLCLSLLGLTHTAAMAWPAPTIVGWPSVGWSSLDIGAIVKKVNVNDLYCGDDYPDCIGVLIKLKVEILSAQYECCNGGLQCGGIGRVFDFAINIVREYDAANMPVSENGKLDFEAMIPTGDLAAEIEAYAAANETSLCINPNWAWQPDTLLVDKFRLTMEVYAKNKDGDFVLADSVCGTYQLPAGSSQFILCSESCAGDCD